jgi:hypothetical protein
MVKGVLEQLGVTKDVRVGTTSSSPFTGSPTFDEVPFHVDAGKQPTLGTYAFVARDRDDLVHYGRIIEGVEDNPRADPSRLQQNQAYQLGLKEPRPGDRAPHVTRTMRVEILGEVGLGAAGAPELREPSALAQTGMGVYEIPAVSVPWLLGLPDSPDKGLNLGMIDSAGLTAPFTLPMEALARHIGMLGKTGVGKSYAAGVMVEELVRHSIPVVSIDVLGDVVGATDDLKGKNYAAGRDLKIPYPVIGLSEFLHFTPNLTREQSELVALAYDQVSGQALDTLNKTGEVSVPLDRLTEAIRGAAAAFGQEAVGERAVRRVEAALGRSELLTTKTEPWLDEFKIQPITNIYVGHLGQHQRNLVVGAVARMLQVMRKRNRIPPFVFLLDEAHLFLPAGGEESPSTRVVRELVRTARHHAIGIVLISQSPSSMDKQVLLTCNTRLVFALDRDDLKVVSGTMGGVSDKVVDRIPKLPKGTCIVSSGMDIMRHPVQIRVRRRETREGAPTPNLAEEVQKWRSKRPT